jgi:hypothetical protein
MKKLKQLIGECKSRNLHCSVTYQKINDISIEIYKGYKSTYVKLFYTDGHIKLKKAIKLALKFIVSIDLNEITIDIGEIYKMDNFSVTDVETIRQISLFCLRNPGHKALYDKIDQRLHYAALYPEIIKVFDVEVDNFKPTKLYDPEVADEVTRKGKEELKNFLKFIENGRYGK